MRRARPVVAAVLAAVLLGGCAPVDPPAREEEVPAGPESGGRLPDVRLDALEGDGELDLGELRGPAVLNLWASWCAPCREELPYYQAFAEQYRDRVQVIGIDFRETDEAAALALAEETGLTYPLYTDPDAALRAVALPQLLLVDASGEVAFSQYLEIDSPAQLAELVELHLGVAP